jgi:hypothetical protein
MSPEMTGQPGAGLVPVPGGVTIDGSDAAQRHDGGSRIAEVTSVAAPDPTAGGAQSTTTVVVTDVEAGERVIVRLDVRVVCRPGATPTGTLHFSVDSASLGGEVVPVGRQTIPVKVDAASANPTTTTATTTTSTTSSTTSTSTTTTTQPTTSSTGAVQPASTSTTFGADVLGADATNPESCNTGATGASATTTTIATPGATLAAQVCGRQAVNAALATTGSRYGGILVAIGLALLAVGLAGAAAGSDPERRLP